MTAVTVRKEDRALNPEIATLYQFHAQKALFEIPKICNINFLIENYPPPLLELFRKYFRFGSIIRLLVLQTSLFTFSAEV